jgi:hypothetical protein
MARVCSVRGSGATVSRKAGDEAQAAPGLRLNRRMKEIIGTGLLPSLSPSALTVLHFAAAYGDFTSCQVFLGAKTLAAKSRWHRNGARRGLAELLDVGFLVAVRAATNRKATVYRLALVRERVLAAQERAATVGARRRKSPEAYAAEAAAKKRPGGEGAHPCAPRGHTDEPPRGTPMSPQGAHPCAPNHSSTVPSSLKERYPSGRSSRRSVEQGAEQRIAQAAVRRRGA